MIIGLNDGFNAWTYFATALWPFGVLLPSVLFWWVAPYKFLIVAGSGFLTASAMIWLYPKS